MNRYLVSQFELENPFPEIDMSCYLEIFDKENEYYIKNKKKRGLW